MVDSGRFCLTTSVLIKSAFWCFDGMSFSEFGMPRCWEKNTSQIWFQRKRWLKVSGPIIQQHGTDIFSYILICFLKDRFIPHIFIMRNSHLYFVDNRNWVWCSGSYGHLPEDFGRQGGDGPARWGCWFLKILVISTTFQQMDTLTETNSSHLKMDGWNTTVLLGFGLFFRCDLLVSGRVHPRCPGIIHLDVEVSKRLVSWLL